MTPLRSLAVAAGSGIAVAGMVHASANLRRLVRPQPRDAPVAVPVAVLIPARNEARRIGATVASALAQRHLSRMTVTVLDDASDDATAQAARAAGDGDPRLTVVGDAREPPAGWLGKAYACQRLAGMGDGEVLVFLDADVTLAPDAISSAVGLLLDTGTDFASPWPRQVAVGLLARLVQPLQQWSWATTLPLGLAARSGRPSLAAANGQFLVISRTAYDRVGGHAAVASCVLEDIELARAMRRAGCTTALWDGSAIAACRMYDDAAQLRAGYAKSLWAAFGPRDASPPVRAAAAAGAAALLALAYLVPPIAAIAGPDRRTRALGIAGYAAAVANRAVVARRTGSPVWPDSLGHPLSIAAFVALTADSGYARWRGRIMWKRRRLAG